MEHLIKTYPCRLSPVHSTLIWGDAHAKTLGSVRVDDKGKIEGVVDAYGYPENNFGSGRCAEIANLHIKGVGVTRFAREGDYGTGDLTLFDAIREAAFLKIIKNRFPDAIDANAVLMLDDEAKINVEHLPSALVEQKPHGELFTPKGLLLRGSPFRFTHLIASDAPRHEKWEALKSACGVTHHALGDAIDAIVENVIRRRAYWFYRRVFFGATSPSNIDVHGNCFDLACASVKADWRNTFVCCHQEKTWEGIFDHGYAFLYAVLCDYVCPMDTAEQQAVVYEHTYLVAKQRAERIYREEALCLLGLTAKDIQSLSLTHPDLVLDLGYHLMAYIQANTDIPNHFNDVEPQYHAADECYRNVECIGLPFRETFKKIVLGETVYEPYAYRVSVAFQKIMPFLPQDDARLNRCVEINRDRTKDFYPLVEIQPDDYPNSGRLIDRLIAAFTEQA